MKEFVKKKAVIVMDSAGLPNYMTMFYMEPGTYEPEDVPELFKIRNKIVPAVLVSQFTNTMIKGVPASLPYQQPKHTISYDEAAAACGRKGKGWHLMTNTEFEDLANGNYDAIAKDAKFDNPISAQEMAVKIISEQNKAGGNYIQNRQQDAENSGANGVQGAAPEDNAGENGKNVFDAAIDKLFPDEK